MTTGPTERLRAALAAEHAAIFAYGRLGILLDPAGKTEAHAAEAAHRARRDALVVHLDQIKAQPVQAETAYALPFSLTTREDAMRLAAQVESGLAATWRSALGLTEGALRRMALDGFCDCAIRNTRWRKLAGVTPVTSVFPGRQG